MAYFDQQCLEALQKIGTELQKIREMMEIDMVECEDSGERLFDAVLRGDVK